MKRTSKVLALMLVMVMLVTAVSGCSGQKGTSEKTASTATVADKSATQTEVAQEKARDPYEFTMYMNYEWWTVLKWGEDTVSKALKDKFNINVNIAKPEGDAAMKLNVMVASDDLPDVIMMERDSSYKKLIQLGKLMPLDNYIEKYPGYKSAVDPKTVNLSKIDGKIYGLLNWATSDKHPTGNGGWAINKKIYEQLGSPKLQTTEDLYSYLKLVKEKNLTADGKPVIPLQFGIFDTVTYSMTSTFGLYPQQKSVIAVNGELKLFFTDPKFTQSMLYANKLWRENLINKDYFVEKSEQIEEKLSTGRVAVYGGGDITAKLSDLRLRLIEKDPGNDYVVIEPIAGPGLEQKDIMSNGYGTLGWNVICITNKAKQPDRIFEFLDYNISDEGTLFTLYGPKGLLYDELDENGYPIMKRTTGSLTEDEQREYGLPQKWTMLGNTLYTDFSKVASDNRLPVEKRDWTIQAMSNIIWKHSQNVDAFSGIATLDPQSPEGIAKASYDDLYTKMIPKIIMAKDENSCRQAIQEAIDNAYKLGFDKVEKAMTETYKKNLEMLGK